MSLLAKFGKRCFWAYFHIQMSISFSSFLFFSKLIFFRIIGKELHDFFIWSNVWGSSWIHFVCFLCRGFPFLHFLSSYLSFVDSYPTLVFSPLLKCHIVKHKMRKEHEEERYHHYYAIIMGQLCQCYFMLV